jgi:hypothetical protein
LQEQLERADLTMLVDANQALGHRMAVVGETELSVAGVPDGLPEILTDARYVVVGSLEAGLCTVET